MRPFEKARADLVKRNDKLDRDQAAKEQEMTKALEGQKKLKKRLEKAKQACAGLEKAVAQREDLVKEEDKRLQEVLDKSWRFTKKLLDDEDYRPPNDEIKRFKNEDAVLAKINHTEKMKEQQLEKRGGKSGDGGSHLLGSFLRTVSPPHRAQLSAAVRKPVLDAFFCCATHARRASALDL